MLRRSLDSLAYEMNNVEFFHTLLILIAGAGVLTWLAERLSIAPAVVLLLGGSAIALTGGPAPDMAPDLLLAAILPPLLMSSSFYTAWKDFRREIVQRLLDEYRLRVRASENAHKSGAAHVKRRAKHLRLELALVAKSREALLRLHDENRIQDAVLHRIENELDLEEFRLQRLLEP